MNYYPKIYSDEAEEQYLLEKQHFELLQQQRFVSLLYHILNTYGVKSLTLAIEELGEDRIFSPHVVIEPTHVNLFDKQLIDNIIKKINAAFHDSKANEFYMSLSYETINLENVNYIIEERFGYHFFQLWEKKYLEEKVNQSQTFKGVKI